MIKKILKIIGVILLLLVLAAIPLVVKFYRDPSFYLRLVSEKLVEDQTVEVTYNYDYEGKTKNVPAPSFCFTPTESGNYTFSAVDLKSDTEVYITMTVVDRYLDDYFRADNRHKKGEESDIISGSTALQAAQPCYVLFTADAYDEDLSRFGGSFKVTVTKEAEEEDPPQLTTEEPVTINVGSEGKACAVFVPPVTGYYRFEHSIVSRDSSKGYSSISSITASNKIKVGLTSDICMLQEGVEYYVWVNANETNSKESRIKLSCMPMNTEKAEGICYVDISEDSAVEYHAEKDCDLAVYTMSAGDPRIVIYETAGFPLRTEDSTEASLSGNPDDIATVLRVKAGTGLHICVFGNITDCRLFITEYTGDGASLTIDDLVPVPEAAAEEEEGQSPDADE